MWQAAHTGRGHNGALLAYLVRRVVVAYASPLLCDARAVEVATRRAR